MDTDSLIVYIKAKYIFIGISKDVKIKFDTSNYKLKGTLPKAKVKKLSD